MHGKVPSLSEIRRQIYPLRSLPIIPAVPVNILMNKELSLMEYQLSTSSGSGDRSPSKGDSEKTTDELNSTEQTRITRNIIFISIAFTMLFSAFRCVTTLQSSIYLSRGLGTISLASIYVSVLASSLFLPSIMVRKLTVKWTMCVSMLGYSAYVAAQFYPRFYTLIPAGVVLGMGTAPMWISQSTYLSHVATVYSARMRVKEFVAKVKLFSLFFLFYETSLLWGNLVSSLVLTYSKYDTVGPDDPHLKECGANFCFSNEEGNEQHFQKPGSEELYTLSTICLVCSLSAPILIAVNVDPLTRYGEKERDGINMELTDKELWVATFLLLKHRYTLLLLPLSLWCGFEQGFFTAQYTEAFVNCTISIHHVGFVMMTHGFIGAIFSMSLGALIEITGRVYILTFGATLNFLIIMVMLHWEPTRTDFFLFYTVAGLWGMCDALWQTHINALYASLFQKDEEIAFSCYRLFEATGFVVACALRLFLCIGPVLYTMAGFLIIGIMCYYIIEWLEFRERRRSLTLTFVDGDDNVGPDI